MDNIKQQFSVFLNGNSELPFCRINFYERNRKISEGLKLLKKVGDFSYYVANDGVVIADATTYAVVHNRYTEIDIYLPPQGKYVESQVSFLMLQAYRYVLANAGQFQMHSAVVTHDGYGVAFCGIPGAGKSTQAHLWEEHLGADALNLDQPCVLFKNDDVFVSGSPWSGKENCYKKDIVPLKTIFFVEQAKENCAVKLSKAEGFSYLFLNNFLLPISDEIEKKHHDAILRIVEKVSIYKLKCTISRDAVEAAHNVAFVK